MSRNSRLAEQIRRELSVIIQMEMRDPRLGMASVSAVELSRDLSFAKIFVTVLDDDKKQTSLDVLNNSSSFLRRTLAGRIIMRVSPRLQFVYDESIERGSKLSSLIDKAISADDQIRQDADSGVDSSQH